MILVGFGVIVYDDFRTERSWHPFLEESRHRLSRREAVNTSLKRAIATVNAGGSRKTAAALADSARALTDSLDETEGLFKGRRQEIDDYERLFLGFVKAAFILASVGVFLAAWGFISWYVKLQRPLDAIVRMRAEEIRRGKAEGESGGYEPE